MATYQQNMFDGASEGYVKYTVSPDFSKGVGSGDVITISGTAYYRDGATKSISCCISNHRFEEGTVEGSEYHEIGYVNKTIAKGKTGTFTVTARIPEGFIQRCSADANGIIKAYLDFGMHEGTGGMEGGSSAAGTIDNANQYFRVIKERRPPTASIVTTDLHAAVSGEQTPLEYFGGYIQNESLPRFVVTFSTDSRDPKLTATHSLDITGGTPAQDIHLTASTSAGATIVNFDLAALDCTGTLTYIYTVTDSRGLSATVTGNLLVYAYSPPDMVGFKLTRYRHDIDQGDIEADDGEKLWLSLMCGAAAVNSLNAWTLTMAYEIVDSGNSSSITITSGSDGQSVSYDNSSLLYDTHGLTFSAINTWNITVTLTDMLNTVQLTLTVLKAGGYFNVEKNGVAVGQRSTGTANEKKFEVAEDYESHFYGGIHADGGIEGVTNYVSGEVDTGGTWTDGKPIYRYTAVFTASIGSSATNIHTIPSGHDKIIRLSMLMDNIRPIPYWATSTYWASIYINGNNIRAQAGSSEQKSHSFVLVMEYTRT